MQTKTVTRPPPPGSTTRRFFSGDHEHGTDGGGRADMARPTFFHPTPVQVPAAASSSLDAKTTAVATDERQGVEHEDGNLPLTLQRKAAFGSGDEADAGGALQLKAAMPGTKTLRDGADVRQRFFPAVQPRLAIGRPNDPLEQEADAMAERVVDPGTSAVSHSTVAEGSRQTELAPDASPVSTLWRRPLPGTADASGLASPLQLHAGDGGLEQTLAASHGGGRALPRATQEPMEDRLGADFSNVRVHDDSKSAAMSESLNADAFTQGSDIYFNRNKYAPDSHEGKKLLGHELTHTIQQGASKPRNLLKGTAGTAQAQPQRRLVQRSWIDDQARRFLSGNAVADFFVGVIAGIIEWFVDIVSAIVDLFRAAFEGSIAAILAIIGIVVIIVLAVAFPEIVIPILLVVGAIVGVGFLLYHLYRVFLAPGLSAYERGKSFGKAIVEALLLFFAVTELIRFVKTYAQVARLAAGASLVQQLRWVRALMGFGDTVKVLRLLAEVGDIEQTVNILRVVRDVDIALELVGLARNTGDLLTILRTEGTSVEVLLAILRRGGINATDIVDLMQRSGLVLTEIRDFMRFPGMTAAELRGLMARPGITAEVLRDLLGRPGMSLPDLKALLDAVPNSAALRRLLDLIRNPAELRQVLGELGNDARALETFLAHYPWPRLQLVFAASRAAATPVPPGQLIRLLNLAIRIGINDEGRIVRFIQNAAPSVGAQPNHSWANLVEWTRNFLRLNTDPLPFASGSPTEVLEYAQMARPDGTSVWVKVSTYDLNHVLKGHTWRYLSWDPANFGPQRQFTTLFGPTVGEAQVMDMLRGALGHPDVLRNVATNPALWIADDYPLLGYTMRVGVNLRDIPAQGLPRLTQAYPTAGPDLTQIWWEVMLAIKGFLGK